MAIRIFSNKLRWPIGLKSAYYLALGLNQQTSHDPRIRNPESPVTWTNPYTDYEVRMRTTFSLFNFNEYSVRRRYRDFVWSKNNLERATCKIALPPLPGKSRKIFAFWWSFVDCDLLKNLAKDWKFLPTKLQVISWCWTRNPSNCWYKTLSLREITFLENFTWTSKLQVFHSACTYRVLLRLVASFWWVAKENPCSSPTLRVYFYNALELLIRRGTKLPSKILSISYNAPDLLNQREQLDESSSSMIRSVSKFFNHCSTHVKLALLKKLRTNLNVSCEK